MVRAALKARAVQWQHRWRVLAVPRLPSPPPPPPLLLPSLLLLLLLPPPPPAAAPTAAAASRGCAVVHCSRGHCH